MERNHRLIFLWLLSGCFLIYIMVVVGGLTRLTHSGLSMVEWKPAGSLPPMNESDWLIQFDKYKQSPEFRLINRNFSLSDFKGIFWYEFIHRMIGRFIGFVFIIPFLFFLFTKKFPPGFIRKMMVLLLIGASQGLLGWFMVKSGLVKNPHVSHYRLAAHLITAFLAFGFSFWFALDLKYSKSEEVGSRKLKRGLLFLFLLVVVQIIFGAFVAGLKAGYLYPTFPKMGEEWFPEAITGLSPMWKNFTEGHAGVQFVHRCLAYLVLFFSFRLFFISRKMKCTVIQKNLFIGLVVIVLMQFLLGVLTLLLSVPVVVASLHQMGAFFLFSIILFLIHRFRFLPTQEKN